LPTVFAYTPLFRSSTRRAATAGSWTRTASPCRCGRTARGFRRRPRRPADAGTDGRERTKAAAPSTGGPPPSSYTVPGGPGPAARLPGGSAEGVAAGAGTGGVRVVDGEALLLDGVDEVDGGAAQVRSAHAVGD